MEDPFPVYSPSQAPSLPSFTLPCGRENFYLGGHHFIYYCLFSKVICGLPFINRVCLAAWPPALGFSWFPSPVTAAQLAAGLTLPAPPFTPSRLGAGCRWTLAMKQWPLLALLPKQKRKKNGGGVWKKALSSQHGWDWQCSVCLSTAPPGQWLVDEELLHCGQACLLRTRTWAGMLDAAI